MQITYKPTFKCDSCGKVVKFIENLTVSLFRQRNKAQSYSETNTCAEMDLCKECHIGLNKIIQGLAIQFSKYKESQADTKLLTVEASEE